MAATLTGWNDPRRAGDRRRRRSTRCSPSAPRSRSSASSSRTSRGAGSAASRLSPEPAGGSRRSATSAPTSSRPAAAAPTFAEAAARSGARMVIGEERAVGELWDAARRRMPRPRDDRPGQPVYALREAPEPGETGLRAARLLDLDLLVPACAAAHREEIGVDPLQRDADGFRWRTRQQIEEGRSWLWLEDGVIRFKAEASAWTPAAVQLQQVWVDPAGAAPRLRPAGAARPLPAAARAGSGRVPLRPAGERAGAAPLRLDRHDARAHLSQPRLLGGTIGGWTSCATVSSASSASTS